MVQVFMLSWINTFILSQLEIDPWRGQQLYLINQQKSHSYFYFGYLLSPEYLKSFQKFKEHWLGFWEQCKLTASTVLFWRRNVLFLLPQQKFKEHWLGFWEQCKLTASTVLFWRRNVLFPVFQWDMVTSPNNSATVFVLMSSAKITSSDQWVVMMSKIMSSADIKSQINT